MNKRPSPLWILGMALLLTLGPAVVWWIVVPWRGARAPVEVFMPDQLSAAVRVSQAREAWRRHWLARRGPAPEDALQRMLEVMDQWPRWIKKHGEAGARLRLTLYQTALFQALGEESWLLFGEWGAAKGPGTGQTGMILLIPADGTIQSRVGPLMDLLLDSYDVERSTVEGVPVYEYKGRREARGITFCQVGGWFCASLRRRGLGPLPLIVRQARQAPRNHEILKAKRQTAAALGPRVARPVHPLPAEDKVTTWPAIAAVAYPKLFWAQLDQFMQERGKKPSEAGLKRREFWQARLDGVDRLALIQSGASLINLRLELNGARPGALREMIGREASATTATLAQRNPAASAQGANYGGIPQQPEIAQVDMALPFARISLPLAGYSWPEMLAAEGLALVAPGLKGLLQEYLCARESTGPGRIGLAAYPAGGGLIPGLLCWIDRPRERATRGAPARIWLGDAAQARAPQGGDRYLWSPPLGLPPRSGIPPLSQDRWSRFTDEVWNRPVAPPLAFAAINFQSVTREIEGVPTMLMKKKARKRLKRWHDAFQALSLGLGGAVLRLDAEGDRWVLSCQGP